MTEPQVADQAEPALAEAPVIVKKYANRRLYNTESSSYITLDNLADMVRAGRDFIVYDARSGEDITRSVLTQIIVDEENKGRAVLPTAFLRQLIGFYGDSLGGMVPRYVEQTMSAIARQQAQVREAMQQTMGNLLPPGLEEMRRQNVAMMERAMSLFSPFYRPGEGDAPVGDAAEELRALRQEVAELRSQLAAKQTGTKP
jgi:polyhydroxyalkanoate synthesis repressor PhaR